MPWHPGAVRVHDASPLLAIVREPRPELYGDALHRVYAVTGWDGDETIERQ